MAAIHFVTRRFPYAQVIIVTPSQTKAPRASLLAMYNLEKAIAERCALPMIDFFTKCGLSDRTDTITNFTLDNTHPNDDGQTLFRLFYVNELRRTICLRRIVTPVVTCE